MSYLEEKIEQFRSLAANPQLTDEMIVAFLQELVNEGYVDSYPAMSIMDGLMEPEPEDKIELAIILPNGYTDVVGRFEPEEAERYLKENADQQFAWRWVCEECEMELENVE